MVRWLGLSDDQFTVAWAIVLGAAVGLAAAGFRWLITGLELLFFHRVPEFLGFAGAADPAWTPWLPLIPMLGGLVVGPMVHRWAVEARGHGVPEVMLALAREGGRIRPRVGIVKAIASAFTLGSGGSAGQEGPIVQIGAALGSSAGQGFEMPPRRIRTFVACGAAAGISAVFNAPISGVAFAIEILIGELRARSLAAVLVGSATAWVVSRGLVTEEQSLICPPWEFLHGWEFVLWVLLGTLCGFAGRLMVVSLYFFEDLFAGWRRLRPWIRPAIGGLAVGSIGLAFPQILGPGFRSMTAAMHGTVISREGALDTLTSPIHSPHLLLSAGSPGDDITALAGGSLLAAAGLMAALALMKILATSLTLGSGGSGGVFTPALFTGAMLGGAFGLVLQAALPGQVAPAGAYAVVGMAGVFAASAHAPITAILIMFEITGSRNLLPAIMVGTVVATMLSYRLSPDSIYTVKFKRRGWRIGDSQIRDPMKQITVREAMATEFYRMAPSLTLRQALLYAETVGQRAYPVAGQGDGELLGIITIHDLNLAIAHSWPGETSILEFSHPDPPAVTPDDYVDKAFAILEESDAAMLPVVSADPERRLMGVVTHATIIRAHQRYQTERE